MATIPLLRLSLHPPATAAATTLRHLTPPRHHLSLKTQTLKPHHKTLTAICSFPATTPISHRLISAATHFLPLLNGLPCSVYLFSQFPSLSTLFRSPARFRSFIHAASRPVTNPDALFLIFFGIYLGIVRNPHVLAEYVKFNAMQAILMNLLLSLMLMAMWRVAGLVREWENEVGYKVMVWGFIVVFVGVLAYVVYCLVCCVLGWTPFLPILSDVASRLV